MKLKQNQRKIKPSQLCARVCKNTAPKPLYLRVIANKNINMQARNNGNSFKNQFDKAKHCKKQI